MKYVAFLDILGFKKKLESLDHSSVKEYIRKFSSTIYYEWKKKNFNLINGYVVSDSVIIYSTRADSMALNQLISLIDCICKAEFKENSILIRGAIAKGEFDKLEAKKLSSLEKGLVVGQAYVEAYLLEGAVKSIGIILSEEVYDDYINADLNNNNVFIEQIGNIQRHVYRYLDINFFSNADNLLNFVNLAINSKWLPHYYNTLYFAFKNEGSEKKVIEVFTNIINIINKNSPSENWRNLDIFIKNCFNDDVSKNFQKRFLKYIRSKI